MAKAGRLLVDDLKSRLGGRLYLLLALMLVASIAEGLGLLLLVPVLAALGGDVPEWVPELPSVPVLLGLFLGAMVLRSLLLYARDRVQARIDNDYVGLLKTDLAAALARLGWARASRIGQARMQQYWNADIVRTGVAVMQALSIAVSLVFLAVQGLIALAIAPRFALLAAMLLGLSIAVSWRWIAGSQRGGADLLAAVEDANRTGFSFHAGLKAALAEGRTDRFLDRYGEAVRIEQERWVALDLMRARARLASTITSVVALVAILFAGLVWLDIAPAILALLVILLARMMGPARQAVEALQGFWANAPAFLPIAELLAEAGRDPGGTASSLPAATRHWSKLEADDLNIGDQADPFGPYDLHIDAGEWVAIAGPSGSGKTLLIDTLTGLLSPVSGTIRLDGEPVLLGVLDGWREGVAYVGQDDAMLGDTPRDMLGLEPGETPTDLDGHIDDVGLRDLIDRLPAGLDTHVGDRGAKLAGGERRRLAILRALLRQPKLLILDEATVALDLQAESLLLARLRAAQPDMSLLFVSHRPQSLTFMDRVVEIG
ncbi:ATP-binding cassette domain-containing protein [Sphingomicrobium sediminis]|uniref:ABC transporter ATP-binding protein/permease n=1 Tax=Sphingomicrobium sediminis TaxID=2950949 RepID=A0A9X2EK52_9SPHN|nr:ABC transporter ATP-binding protein [Sphingomicrobium sediminis]MCM8558316.1 ABC transporter ATP-binding protein/permease [Sphingomicrobium sediminis]